MKTRTIKFLPALSAMLFLTAAFICLTSFSVSAQIIETGDIIYSRLPAASGSGGTIWAVRQDGTNDRQIVVGSQPRLSPNNRYLLFRRSQFPTEPYRFGQIFVRDLTTNSETLLFSYSDYVVGYDFTPDSAQIVYDFSSGSIYKINLDGTNPVSVGGSSSFDDFPVVRTSDGLIAHHRYDSSATAGIYTLTVNGATQQLVPNTLNNIYPAWSADGQFIAYGIGSPVGTYPYIIANLFKIKPDGSGRIQLTNLAASDNFGSGYVWTANNAKIIVPANLNNVAGLYFVNADGGGSPVLIPITAGANPDFVGAIAGGQSGGGSGNYQLLQSVIAGGGTASGGGNYSLTSTIGEAIAGVSSTGGTYNLGSGFWGGGQSSSSTGRTLFDFDGDGKADVSVFRPSNGSWYLLQSTAGFTGAAFGFSSDKIVPADYDGDGKTDIAVYRPSNGTWYLLQSTAGFTGIQFGNSTDIPVPADYDGDGKAEIAVFRPSNGYWYGLNLANNQFTAIPFGQNGDVPVAADYDGDGKSDVAVFRPSNGAWYLLQSTAGFTGIQFGFGTDLPVRADYDGDGKTDIAVFRPSNGTWYLQQSSAGFTGIAFGQNGDRPAAADYDGDGKADVAVYRGGTWYLNRTTAGFTGIPFGDGNDKPIPGAFVP